MGRAPLMWGISTRRARVVEQLVAGGADVEAVDNNDADAVEWMEQQWAKEDRAGFRETHVLADRGAVAMRRIVQRMADAERIEV